ncbi:hypothetical protein [Mesonia aestuariivivens]|uniref:DUF559 domain-containing protein n=1 Tax=Mesonia aestuariivivens TaxID=2796128 RepID=A0ABS6W0C0_9FLAO|nr:hypothetical protein [Mesonia aestuariivivens]MBW2961287.1 hypothetical protein [Mesonia aestuariivivens]
MSWTISDLKKKNLNHNYKPESKPKVKLPKIEKISVEKETIKKILWLFHREGIIPDYVEELQFDDVRQFRFDWAIPQWKLAIEYEGIFSNKSGHTTIGGYTKDCVKYNLAQLKGWKVLRYTAKNYQQLSNDLKYFKEKVI